MPWRRCSCNPHLKPALEEAIAQFPLKILGFHSDNGSEFINHVVARLLNKLRIQQTKSRSRQCNDNALVEGKNGTIVQKHMGHMHIPQCHDARINDFYRHYWNVYLNFHRPSGLAEIKSDAKGKLKKIYKSYFTPFEAFTGHPTASKFLKNGRTLENSPKWPISRVIMNASLPRKKQRTTYSLHSHLSRNDGSEFQYRLLIGKYFHAAIY